MIKEKHERLKFAYLPLDLIDVSISNVRKSNLEEGIKELSDSIREIGVQQPIVVARKHDRYELIIGQRRYIACKKLGRKTIPALIKKVKNETDKVIISFSENIHRLDIEYRHKMQAATLLMQKLGSVKNVAQRLGVSEPTVTNYLGYAAVPDEIKKMVDEGKLGATTALEIVRNIQYSDRAIEVAKRIKEIPRSEDREYFIDVTRENPDKSVGAAFKVAKKRSDMRKITIHVTKKVYDLITEAAARYDRDRESIVKEAVNEWLAKRGLNK